MTPSPSPRRGGRRFGVAMIGSRGFPGQRAGIERVLESVAPRLVASGRVSVDVYCPSWLEYAGETYKGVRLVRVPGLRTKYADTFTRSFLASLRELRGANAIVHFHSIGSGPFALLPRLVGKRVTLTVHALDWQRAKWSGFGSLYLRVAEWLSMRLPHQVIAVSEDLKADLEARHGRPVRFIANGAEPRRPRPLSKIAEHGLERGKFLLFVGRLVPEKGVHLLIEAFRRLSCGDDLKLAIVGPAWFESEYGRELVSLAGGDERVMFLGEADDDLLGEYYSNCAAFVLPSDVEGMSLSLLDALAYGSAIVTSSIPQNANLVGDAGLVFDAGDASSLCAALEELLGDDALADELRERAQRRAGGEYDWDRIADQWLDAYDELLGST